VVDPAGSGRAFPTPWPEGGMRRVDWEGARLISLSATDFRDLPEPPFQDSEAGVTVAASTRRRTLESVLEGVGSA
jgi:hypothetical protein